MRVYFFAILLFCILMLGAALFLQLVMGLNPCPLCVSQRMVIAITAIIALLAMLLTTSEGIIPRFWSFLLFIGGATSLAISSYQVWLVNQPPENAASCGPGLEVFLDKVVAYLPQHEWTETVFRSSASCTDGLNKLFGFEVANLTFPIFIIFAVFLLWLLFKRYDEYDY